MTTLKTQGGKQRVEQDNFMVLSPPSSSHKKKEISLSRLKWSETCLLPADISEQRNSEKFVSFTNWLASFKNNAIRKGISSATVHSAFKNVHLIDRVVQLDRKQAEYALSFTNYINNAISISRIQRGRRKIQENAKILRKIQRKYGVSSEILIALWGLESNFGRFTGNFSTLNTLATLAYDGRRHNFFTNELLCALTMLDSGNITVKQMTGSWAGAMGQPQFMPSTFQYYATDGNGDGKKDIWQNTSDVLASAANYLYKLGWKKKEPWGVEVILPQNFTLYQAKLSVEKTLEQWGSLGVKKSNGKELQGTGRKGSIKSSMKGSIILPAGLTGPAFLVFHNFRIIREWNRSINYALAVGYLADRITGGSPLTRLDPQRDKNLSRQNAVMIQTVLASMGYYRDKIDGMVGIKSREAIREYQRDKGITADGYPSDSLIFRLRQERL
ncbi:lytic murein transglycosylase [Desulfobulbus sp. TB]|nr:lytic murein transglycosylase [Desulfobulbus sp. TB]